jgi:hypothetical protein
VGVGLAEIGLQGDQFRGAGQRREFRRGADVVLGPPAVGRADRRGYRIVAGGARRRQEEEAAEQPAGGRRAAS